MSGALKMEFDYKEYWKKVWNKETYFPFVNETDQLPWDIDTYDNNLKDILDTYNILNGNVLELGCGTGHDSFFLASQGFNVIGIDISKKAIDKAVYNYKHKNLEFICKDFFEYNTDKKFKIIYDRGFIHNYQKNYINIFEKLNQLIEEKGKYIFISGNYNQPIIDTAMPSSVYITDIERYSAKWFKIILVKEILYKVNKNFKNCLGYLFVLEKRNSSETVEINWEK